MKPEADKLQDHLAYPPRAFRAERAAAYLSMGKSTFLKLVEEGKLPPPLRVAGIPLWDRLDLDAAVEDWKGKGSDEVAPQNSWAAIREAEERD